MFEQAMLLGFLFLTLCGAFHDILSYRIPNWISVAVIVLFVPYAVSVQISLPDIGLHLGLFALVLAIGFILFAGGLIGGGDAKLVAACALWLGPSGITTFLIYTGMTGMALAATLILLRNLSVPVWVMSNPVYVRLSDKEMGAPYGVAIAAGAMIASAGMLSAV